MADYHPLDTRYTGPSTAYRGSAKKREPAPKAKPVIPSKRQSAPAMNDGPWGKGPPPLPVPGQKATPPPIPVSAQIPPIKRRNAGRRVLFGAIILIAIVLLNAYLTRSVGLTVKDLEDSLRQMDTFDSRTIQTEPGVKL